MIEELIIRTLCDTLPSSADGVFLFGQTADNQEAVFEMAKELVEQKLTDKVMFLGTKPMSGYPGFENWKRALKGAGLKETAITAIPPVPSDTDLLHTRIEAESVVSFAKAEGYRKLIVVASPFQQTRAFMAAVTATQKLYPQLQLYSLAGKAMSWSEEVKHSQGKVQGTRAGLIAGEMERIKKYHAKGDLASVAEVLEYLNKRDRGEL
ncbi:YdcF family protein [Pontibacter harenae]|uniref:YdcF family protein n=1 Tax=Pontibacter harenae TaxID=2894083 RepID=UPI001E2965DC|nr:YdcF family protein [Pontibacter harenae]MCC9165732.1 YdcF family protein [Pontibacter harenae]